MDQQQALPNAEEAVASEPVNTEAPAEVVEGAEVKTEEAKPEKTPAEKELARERRRIQNLTRQKYELQAELDRYRTQVAPRQEEAHNRAEADDSDTLSMPRAELERLIEEQARKLAPTIGAKEAEAQAARERALSLQKSLGDRFETVTDDLAAVFSRDQQLLILESDQPAALAEYLTDPDNAAVADRIARLSPVKAAWEMAKISANLAAKPTKPQASKAPAPLEPVRGQGSVSSGAPDPKDTKSWIKWRMSQPGF